MSIHNLLTEQGFIVLDGALATELERRGANIDDPLWSAKLLVENPDLIRQVHHDYFVAGADVAITASYQATLDGFVQRGLSQTQAAGLMQRSVRLAQEAREQFWAEPPNQRERARPLVAASVGPYGAYLADGSEYRGDYGLTGPQLMDFHRTRMSILVGARPDLLACETIPCQLEAEALIALLREFPQQRAWLSFSCRDGEHLCHGEALADCVALANESPQVVAVGVNCTAPQHVESLLRHARAATDKPLLAYPNSGETWDASTNEWSETVAAPELCASVDAWFATGAKLIGGCCRTTPDDICAVRQRLANIAA